MYILIKKVALPSTNSEIGNGIVIRPKYIFVPKHLVTKRIQLSKTNLYVSGGDPFLQFLVIFKIICPFSSL